VTALKLALQVAFHFLINVYSIFETNTDTSIYEYMCIHIYL